MTAWITYTGRFKKEVAGHLADPKDCYDHVREGQVIMTDSIKIMNHDSIRFLASCLNVDFADYNTHPVDTDKIDFDRLWRDVNDAKRKLPQVLQEQLKVLVNNGFKPFFRIVESLVV